MANSRRKTIYEFEDFRLDAAHLLLYQNERQISLAPKVVETLLALVERHGEVLSKEKLMEIVWADSIVEESNLSQNLYLLRKTLGAGKNGKPLIETLRRRGYRFNGDVSRIEPEQAENPLSDNPQPAAPQISTNGHHYNVERRGNVLALTDWKTNGRSETENADSQSQISVENSDSEIKATENAFSLVGRGKEISRIGNLLSQNDVRLVTLAGVGGTGKTRLAQAISEEIARNFADGVFFVELAAITNPEFVASTIAQTLGVKETGSQPILESLKGYLRDKQILIVVDNFEQVIDAAPNIAELLAAADNLKILITSRVLLHLSAEREFIVPPLAVPEQTSQISLSELSNYEAIELFVERARSVKPNFALTNENANDVAEICARLDGLPLAIELAAARIKILSPRAILGKMENRLKLLTGGASDLPARQQTMRGAIEWSYDLLTEDEKHLFRRLAVFAGGFTFEAAEVVCGNYELEITNYDSSEDHRLKTADRIEVLDLITSLVDKSLLASKEQTSDEQRFRMLETVREYALESLEKNDEAEAIRRSHAAYFLALGEAAEPHLQTAQTGKWLNRLEDEHDNLRGAIRWLFENEAEMAARLAAAIRTYLFNHCHLTEGREWLEAALECNDELPAGVRLKLLNGLGYLAVWQGEDETARKFFEEVLAEGRIAGDKRQIAKSLRGLGAVAHSLGDFTAARKFHEEGLAIHRELNDKSGIAASLNGLGYLALNEGDSTTAHTLLEESLKIFRLLGNESSVCYCLLNLGAVAYINSDYKAAQEYYVEVVMIAQNSGYKDRISDCLDGFASLAAKRRELELAVMLAGAAEHLREQIGYKSDVADRQRRNAHLAELKTKIDESAFVEFYEQGRELKLEEAIALCLEKNDSIIQPVGDKPFDEHLGKSRTPEAEKTTKVLQAMADGANLQTVTTNYDFTRQINESKFAVFAFLTALIIAAAGTIYIWNNFINKLPANFQAQKSTRLTAVGKAVIAAISPDGKYVVYVAEDDGQQSLWLRHIASESTVQLLPPDKNKFSGLQFSPDSNHIYYNSRKSLYQIPVLGGTPGKVLDDINGGVTFSPDGKQIAFRRIQGELYEVNSIIIADADGANQRQLISREDIFDSKLAWSPDGKVIACVRVNREKLFTKEILAVQAADGSAALIPSPLWITIGQIVWMPDGKSLLIVATAGEGDEAGSSQILQMQYPSGETRNVTKDSSDYTNVSLTADGHSLVSVKLEQTAHIWAMPADDINRLRQLTFGSDKFDGSFGISWLPDGRIVYNSAPDKEVETWVVGADGNNSRQLTTNASFTTVSPDGHYLVYQNTIKEKLGLWRMDISDGSKKQLTQKADLQANFSPDGKWIIYQGFTDQTPPASLYKVSIDGGESVQLTNGVIPYSPTVSLDGKQIAFSFGKMEEGKYKQYIALIPFDGGEISKVFGANLQNVDAYGKQNLQWTSDGRGIYFVALNDGVSNIWRHAIDGSAPVQITNFTTDRIFNFAFSPDGSQIALSRGAFNSDVVLIENTK